MLGIVIAVIGIVFIAVGFYAFNEVQAGFNSLAAFSEAQNVTLTYNEDGQLVDRGEPEGAAAIMALLTDDWGYKIKSSEFDPSDPLINTASEYMYQMATISYHVLHGTQTIVLDEDVEYNGELFAKGEHEFAIEGRYWTDFDRNHPLEGPARGLAWTGTAHALIGELGVGAVTASALELGRGLSLMVLGMGATFGLLGLGFVWVAREVPATVPARRLVGEPIPA
jgi:hypothetical protein